MKRRKARPASDVVIDVASPSPPPEPIRTVEIRPPPPVAPAFSLGGLVIPLPLEARETLERYAEIGGELAALARQMGAAADAFVTQLERARSAVEKDARALRRRPRRRRR